MTDKTLPLEFHIDELTGAIYPVDINYAYIDRSDLTHVIQYSEYKKAIDKIEILEDALKFYANKNNWFSGGMEGDGNGYSGDHGNIATKALAK